MKTATKILMFTAVLAFVTGSAMADVKVNNFSGEIDQYGNIVGGEGPWYPYPSGWWNQWFYNDPYDPLRWKIAKIEFTLTPTSAANSYAEVTIDWSTAQWSIDHPGQPPLPEPWGPVNAMNEDMYIGRVEPSLFNGEVPQGGYDYDGDWTNWKILVEDYNPEWVSIDIRGVSFTIDGTLWHECVPEPATISLLVLGGIGALLRRRRK